jgi:alkaline phosphatase D
MKIAFASCMDALRAPDQPVWAEIQSQNPDIVLLLGDQIYMDWGDLGESNWKTSIESNPAKAIPFFAEDMHQRYARQWQVASFQSLMTQMVLNKGAQSVRLTWDDHDFAWNNSVGLPESGAVYHGVPLAVKTISKRLFLQFSEHLKNPARPALYPRFDPATILDPTPEVGGVESFRALTSGASAVDFALLDTRWYRTDRGQANAEILGANQMQALRSLLTSKPAGLVLIAAATPMKYRYTFSPQAWAGSGGHASYIEYAQLLDAARQANRPVLFISGDVHRNSYGGLVRSAATAPSQVVQVISSGAAIGQIGPKKFPPRFGVIDLALDQASLEIGLWVQSPSSPFGWSLEAPNQPYLDASTFADLSPIPLLVLRDRVSANWPSATGSIQVDLEHLDGLEQCYKQRITTGNVTNPNFFPDPCLIEPVPATPVNAAGLRMSFAGNPHLGDARAAETEALIRAAFERALHKPGEKSVTLFVHGTGSSMSTVIDHCYYLRARMGTEPIGFAWPSGLGGGGLASYLGGVSAIHTSAKCFLPLQGVLRVFNAVAGEPRYQDVAKVLLGRSTGARIFQAALASMTADPPTRRLHFSNVSRVVLSAPMTKSADFASLTALGHVPPIFVCLNTSDQTLKFADKIDGTGSLLGLDFPDASLLNAGMRFLNFTQVGRLHEYLLPQLSVGQQAIAQALFQRVPFDPASINGVTAHLGVPAGTIYDIA